MQIFKIYKEGLDMSFNRFSLVKWLALPVVVLAMTGCGSDAYVRDGGGTSGTTSSSSSSGGSSGSTSSSSSSSSSSGGSGNITITDVIPNPKYILSVCDDRTNPPTRHIGEINADPNNLKVRLVYNVPTGSATYSTSQSGTMTDKDGTTFDAKLVVDPTTVSGTGYLNGYVVSEDGATHKISCEALKGNYYGFSLGTIDYTARGADAKTLEIRASAYVISDDGGEIVPPIVGPDGSCWLKHNLGAHYITVGNPYFNPDADAGVDDIHAYGNLWQWGRNSDGHQLINHLDAYTATAVNPATTAAKSDLPASSVFITGDDDWRVNSNDLLWLKSDTGNQVCPSGWRVATDEEWFAINGGNDSNGINGSFAPPAFLHLSRAGKRVGQDGTVTSQGGVTDYWTSTVRNGQANAMRFWGYTGKNDSTFQSSVKTNGRPIRCRFDSIKCSN